MLVDSFLNEYLITLGEFNIDEFDKQEDGMVWLLYLLFIATTFIT